MSTILSNKFVIFEIQIQTTHTPNEVLCKGAGLLVIKGKCETECVKQFSNQIIPVKYCRNNRVILN